jgi:hypothetical protein
VVERVTKIEMTFFIAVEDESWTIRGGWPATMTQIQCFDFGSRGEAMG